MTCFTRNISCTLVSELYPLRRHIYYSGGVVAYLEIWSVPVVQDLGVVQDTAYSGAFHYGTNVMPYLISRFMTNLTATDRTTSCFEDGDCTVKGTDFVNLDCILADKESVCSHSKGRLCMSNVQEVKQRDVGWNMHKRVCSFPLGLWDRYWEELQNGHVWGRRFKQTDMDAKHFQ